MVRLARNLAIDNTRSKEFSKDKKTGDIDNYVHRVDNKEYTEQKVEEIGLNEVIRQLPEEQRFIIVQLRKLLKLT
jgi:RNA polymerase sigma-70 factor (ECF subfamily)